MKERIGFLIFILISVIFISNNIWSINKAIDDYYSDLEFSSLYEGIPEDFYKK